MCRERRNKCASDGTDVVGCGLWLWFGVTLIESSSSQFFGAEGFLGLWWGYPLPILSMLWVEKQQTLTLGMGVGVSLQTPSPTPVLSPGRYSGAADKLRPSGCLPSL